MPIHNTAIIANGAQIAASADIGPYAVIGANVTIGSGTTIGAHAVIDGHTVIGKDCRIFAGATIGLAPQDLSYNNEPTGVIIGDRVTAREYVTIHRASKEGNTIIGDDCFLMNFSHVAHNCRVGKGVIMANSATLAGHVVVGDYTVMGGLVVVHQHVNIGRLIMIGGLTGTRTDLPPFSMIDGRPGKVVGINKVGMRRQKISQEVRTAINNAYRIIYRMNENLTNALSRIEREIHPYEEINEIVEFYRSSKRGVVGHNMEEHLETQL